jgi:hypothetical protein
MSEANEWMELARLCQCAAKWSVQPHVKSVKLSVEDSHEEGELTINEIGNIQIHYQQDPNVDVYIYAEDPGTYNLYFQHTYELDKSFELNAGFMDEALATAARFSKEQDFKGQIAHLKQIKEVI